MFSHSIESERDAPSEFESDHGTIFAGRGATPLAWGPVALCLHDPRGSELRGRTPEPEGRRWSNFGSRFHGGRLCVGGATSIAEETAATAELN
jgi:hypothetical protein